MGTDTTQMPGGTRDATATCSMDCELTAIYVDIT